MSKACPLCLSANIELTDFKKVEHPPENTPYGQVSARVYCRTCKKGMGVIGVLLSTAKEVEG